MRRKLSAQAPVRFLPLCLLTPLACQGHYVLGEMPPGHAGSGGGDTTSNGGGNTTSNGGGNTTSNGGSSTTSNGGDTTGNGDLPQFACTKVASQQFDSATMQPYYVSPEVQTKVANLVNGMSATEKATQMIGIAAGQMDYQDVQRSPDVLIAGGATTIRGYNYRDAGRGVNLDAGQPNNRASDGNDFSTVFPTTSLRAASWDLELEKRVGEAIADETAASRNNLLLAPCMNIIRHPYWGRTQETYSEDTYHTGRMAAAFTVGIQTHVVACAKHYAANNIELLRSTQNAIMNEQTLREIYGRHFEMVVQDGGIGCIMASYNKINGVKNTQNKHLLRDILKAPVAQGGFGFQGFVLSDWWAMPGDNVSVDGALALSLTKEAVEAGLDVEVPWTLHYSVKTLTDSAVDQMAVTEAARRVLTEKFRFKTALDTDGWSRSPAPLASTLSGASIATNLDHEALAEESALQSVVLLQNGAAGAPVLPLTAAAKNIAVVGPDREFELFTSTVPKTCVPVEGRSPRYCDFHFATDAALGDRGSSRVNADPERTIGPFTGIQAAAGGSRQVTSGNSAAAAENADAIVVVVGYTPGDEGEEYAISEGGDRHTLNLPEGQNEFVGKVLDLNKPTVIIVESGSIVNLPWLSHANKQQATIWAGYPGLRGGAALGKLIFGAANFAGKMPLAWPTQGELDALHFKTSDLSTTMGYFFGYREYDRRKAAGLAPALVFPFGHGLSYSKFAYSNLTVPCDTVTKDAVFQIEVDIENRSTVDGDEIAMLFVKPPPRPAGVPGDRPVKELKSFARVSVKAGQKVTAKLPLRIRDLRRWEGGEDGKWRIDSGSYTILVGKNADDAEAAPTQGVLVVQGD